MFKFSVLGLIIWQGIYGISCQDKDKISDTEPLAIMMNQNLFKQSSNDHGKNLTRDNLGRYYNINAGNITINMKGRSTRPIGLRSFVKSNRKIYYNYVETSGIGAHKLYRSALPWRKARKICAKEQGHLTVIRSDSEEKIILQMMEEMSIEDAWLGIHDQFKEGDWITVMDEPLGETGWANWSSNFWVNPDNFQGNQHCARLLKDGGGMDDENCELPKPFVCKISSI